MHERTIVSHFVEAFANFSLAIAYSISWDYVDGIRELSIDDYEAYRPSRRETSELVMNRKKRLEILQEEWGYTRRELMIVSYEVGKVREQRTRTVMQVQRAEQRARTMLRLRRAFSFNRRKKQGKEMKRSTSLLALKEYEYNNRGDNKSIKQQKKTGDSADPTETSTEQAHNEEDCDSSSSSMLFEEDSSEVLLQEALDARKRRSGMVKNDSVALLLRGKKKTRPSAPVKSMEESWLDYTDTTISSEEAYFL